MTVWRSANAVVAAVLGLSGSVFAQLQPQQVLVVYDSRVADSKSVAEYYAGSAKVPGGVGSLPGKRPLVNVWDIASSGAAIAPPGNTTYANFKARVRDPLRTHLTATGLSRTFRCIVLTKGFPHRIEDIDNALIGDNPGGQGGEFTPANDATSASVDSELTLLYQNLDQGEAGGAGDSKADGVVLNPYYASSSSISQFATNNIAVAKNFTIAPGGTQGPQWQATSGLFTQRLTAGDICLVVRLDAKTVGQVQGMIDRAQGLVVNPTSAALLFDEDSNAFDGTDYETSRTLLQNDGRFRSTSTATISAPGVNYNNASGAANFYRGPLIPTTGGVGVLVNAPVFFLATYGSNHLSGKPTVAADASDFGLAYAKSFNFAPGAIFNTIESYNGRDFGGVGGLPSVPQEQLSDFLEGGGTFGLGNVWEPFAAFVGDNQFLVSNFVLGGLSWAEAAYTSLPVLSWQQIVLGDPLATVTRTTDDINADGVLNLEDLYAYDQLPPADIRRDVNRSGTIEAGDRVLLLKSLRFAERSDLQSGR